MTKKRIPSATIAENIPKMWAGEGVKEREGCIFASLTSKEHGSVIPYFVIADRKIVTSRRDLKGGRVR